MHAGRAFPACACSKSTNPSLPARPQSPDPAFDAARCDVLTHRRLDFLSRQRHAVAIIGDGAITGGMAYEAMNNAGAMGSKLIVILNDNEMSIAPPVGALNNYLTRLLSSKEYRKLRELGKDIAEKLPHPMETVAKRAEEYARGMVTGGTLFEELGFYYIGPVDGHDMDNLVPILENIRDRGGNQPVLLHIKTEKGYGYPPAEAASDKYHGVPKFDVATGKKATTVSKTSEHFLQPSSAIELILSLTKMIESVHL